LAAAAAERIRRGFVVLMVESFGPREQDDFWGKADALAQARGLCLCF
jgi:hypothetical protein